MIINFDIGKILVHDGNFVNILSCHVIKKMGITLQELKNVNSPLVGIGSKPVKVEEDIKLLVTIGRSSYIKTIMTNFMYEIPN